MNVTAIDVFQEWLDDYLNFERAPQKNKFWLELIIYVNALITLRTMLLVFMSQVQKEKAPSLE